MVHILFASPAGERSLKKLPVGIRNFLIEEINTLKNNPHAGKSLRGKLSKYYSLHIKLVGVEYRVVYEINNQAKEIIVHHVGTRENFYKEIERKLK